MTENHSNSNGNNGNNGNGKGNGRGIHSLKKRHRVGFCLQCDAPTDRDDPRAAFMCDCGYFNMSADVHQKIDGFYDRVFREAKLKQTAEDVERSMNAKNITPIDPATKARKY